MVTRPSLQQEIKKRRPFDVPEEEAFLNVWRTSSHLHADHDSIFREAGITGAQYNVLRILRGAGGEGLPTGEIAGRMISRVPDITRIVDRLEASGLVERERLEHATPGGDRRVVLVKIAAKGLELLARIDGPILDVIRGQLGHMTRKELAELNRLLVKARHPPNRDGVHEHHARAVKSVK